MDVTVAVCTWNRANLLDQTLQQMRQLMIPPDLRWELLVVNNHCTDATDRVIQQHADQLPIRRLYEPEPGLSNARNCAISAAAGALLVWTDDDVLVDPQWLAEYAAAARTDTELAFFGGPIEPWFEVDPPAWLVAAWPRVTGAFAVRPSVDSPRPVDSRNLPFGANWAIRTDLQRRYLYNTHLGRIKNNMLSGEETTLLNQLLAGGHRGRWVPAAKVQHFIPRERLTLDYLGRYFYGLGQTDALLYDGSADPSPGRTWLRWRGWSRAMFASLRYRVTRRIAGPRQWVRDWARQHYHWGRLAGAPDFERNDGPEVPKCRAA